MIAWTEGMRLMLFDGSVRELAPRGAFASLAASGGAVLAAWESGNGISVQRLR